MQRYALLAALMLLSPSAYADSISFTVGGHRVHIQANRHCRSPSCASVSVSGVYRSRDRYDDDDRYEDDRVDSPPAKPQPAPPIVTPPPPPASNPPVRPLVVATPPAVYRPAASATQIVAAPPPPKPVAPAALAVPPAPPPPPAPLPPVARPAEPVRPAPPIARVSHDVEGDADSPIGDWQTEGKGTVRIGKCGKALCGYVLNSSSSDKGEAVLINMKPKKDRQWTGGVYSHASGDTYYGTIDLKSVNTLRVEACAFGRFYCSGNNWSRITGEAESLISSRQALTEPRS